MDKRKWNRRGMIDRLAGAGLLVVVLGCGYSLQFIGDSPAATAALTVRAKR